jgi:hypothetical protein
LKIMFHGDQIVECVVYLHLVTLKYLCESTQNEEQKVREIQGKFNKYAMRSD